ncbi:MAG: prepilin-type N-terminal cleavage/methylation domain-containing protein [Fimbriimonadaceae bacterium]
MERVPAVKAAKARGISLVEILVVVAIVAVLTAIAVPVYFQVQHRSKVTETLSNMKQLYVASNLYYVDHDDRVVPVVNSETPNQYAERYKRLILPYASEEVFWSPLDPYRGTDCFYSFTNCLWSSFEQSLFVMDIRSNSPKWQEVLAPEFSSIAGWKRPPSDIIFLNSIYLRGEIVINGSNYQPTVIGRNLAVIYADGNARILTPEQIHAENQAKRN